MAAIAPSEETYLDTGVFALAKNRIVWLLVLMISATFTGLIIRHFEGTLSQVVALSAYIPMLMGTGGNAGAQSSTTIIPVSYTHLDVYKRQLQGSSVRNPVIQSEYDAFLKLRFVEHLFPDVLLALPQNMLIDTTLEGCPLTIFFPELDDVHSRCGFTRIKQIDAAVKNAVDYSVHINVAIPVSYTHLDVYKRQEKFFLRRRPARC